MSLDDLMEKRDQLKNLAEAYPDKREKLFQAKKKLEVVASNIKISLGIDLTEKRNPHHERENGSIKKKEISV